MGQILFSDRARVSWHRLTRRKFHLNMRKSFFTVRETAVGQAAQRGCAVPSEDTQNLPGHRNVQPGVGEKQMP